MHTHPPTHCKIAGLCTHFNLAVSGPCCKIFALIIMLCFRMFKPLTMNEQLVFPVQLHTSHSHFIRMPVKIFKHVFGLMCSFVTQKLLFQNFLKTYSVENTWLVVYGSRLVVYDDGSLLCCDLCHSNIVPAAACFSSQHQKVCAIKTKEKPQPTPTPCTFLAALVAPVSRSVVLRSEPA